MAKPINDEHALLCGMVWGTAMKYGIPMNPTQDDDGDYTDTLELLLDTEVTGGVDVHVYLTVRPPAASDV